MRSTRVSLLLGNSAYEPAQFVTAENEDGLRWNTSYLESYVAKCQSWLRDMAVLYHVVAGGPPRRPELLSTTFANTQTGQRNVYIANGKVMSVLMYHKGSNATGFDKVGFIDLPS